MPIRRSPYEEVQSAECKVRSEVAITLPRSAFALHSALRTLHSPHAFTLTELMVVIGVIVLMMLAAVPLFSFITGSRSIDAAENIVAAMIARARGEALTSDTPYLRVGVAFLRHQKTPDRVTVALVGMPAEELYNAWTTGVQYLAPRTAPPENPGHVVMRLVAGTPEDNLKPIVKFYRCIVDHVSDATNGPPGTFWAEVSSNSLDFLPDAEFQLLPPGVGVQTINSFTTDGPAGAGNRTSDAYLSFGVILFDPAGVLESRAYSVEPLSKLSQALASPVATELNAQFGVVLYDRRMFAAAGGNETDPAVQGGAYDATERAEETWLDNNALPLLINRYNGTMVRGE